MTTVTDLLIVGGGINGAGIARDAVGRGLSVVLCEQGDLAGYTSSASTKLIHGGLRYLEYYEFRLVREALFERERLLESAPHIIWPLRFILPHAKGIRPAWFVRLGLFLYDHLAPRRKLPGTERLNLRTHPAGAALKPGFDTAFAYSDCWVEDSRLVALCALDAADVDEAEWYWNQAIGLLDRLCEVGAHERRGATAGVRAGSPALLAAGP